MSETSPISTPAPESNKRSWLLLGLGVLVLLVMIGVAVWLFAGGAGGYSYRNMLVESPDLATDFTLTGHNGQPVTLSDYRGKLVLLYFGYTTCPDICPTTLAELHKAMELLGKQADDVQVMMVTVDPGRDNLPKLGDYMTTYDSRFLGLSGDPDKISEVATYYGAYYEKYEGSSALGYLVDHTTTVLVIDRQGYLRVIIPYGAPAEDIAADLEYLLEN